MAAKPELRIGLIGYGSWTRAAYLPALRRDGRAHIAAVVARSEATRQIARAELGPDVLLPARLEDVPAGAALDAVMLAVPDAMHEAVLSVALEGRAAILYEPPITDRRAHIEPMLARLLASPLVTYADLELAFIPAVSRAAELVAGGDLGAVQTVSIQLQADWGPIPHYDLCNINHLSTWYADVLNRILGAAPSRVLVLDGHGVAGRRQSRNIAHFDYAGVWGTLDVNIASVGELRIVVRINGSDGDLRADLLTGTLLWRSRAHAAWTEEHHPALQPYASWPGMNESVAAFLDAVERGRATVNSAPAVARLQAIGLAAEASLDSGTWAPVRA
jgi:predicted dehydrogenase